MHPDELMEEDPPRDRNKCDFTGVLVEAPKLKILASGQKSAKFTFLNIEDYNLSNGTPGSHYNYFTFEALGRQAEAHASELIVGRRYQIESYARADEKTGVVVFRVYKISTDRVYGARRK